MIDIFEELSLVDSADLETRQVQVVLRRTQNAYRVIQTVPDSNRKRNQSGAVRYTTVNAHEMK